MKNPLIAKITRPKLSGAYPRTRLFKLLDGCRDTPVTWISSPAGSGKTTLVASYLDARKLPCLWYQLDAGDADPATFFYYLGLAAKKAAPRHKRSLPLLTPEYLMNVGIFSKRYFESLCSRLKIPFVLVFDNYHEIAQDSPFHEIFREGLAALPDGMRVVVISRQDPPPSHASLKAGSRLGLIGREDLMLSLEESTGLIHATGRKNLLREAINQMHDKAHGWAAGIILLSKGAQAAGNLSGGEMDKRTPEEVFDYFANELFDRTEPKIRDFLLKTAYLPQITIETAKMLTGQHDADHVLDRLYRRNYFTEKRHQPQLVYQYHTLFREFLLDRARSAYGAIGTIRLQKKAAGILEASGRIEDAAELLRSAGDGSGFAGLIMQQAPLLVQQGRFRTLDQWLRGLPGDMRDHHPWLLYWRGICTLPLDPPGARKFLEKAFALFSNGVDTAGELLAWSAIVDTFVYEWNDFTPLDRWIAWFDSRKGRRRTFPSPEIEARVMLSIALAATLRQPHHPDLGEWWDRALSLARSAADDGLILQARSFAVSYYFWIGDNAGGMRMVQEIYAMARAPQASPMHQLTWKWLEAAIMIWEQMSPVEALQRIADALAFAEETGVHVWDHMLCALGYFAAIATGDPVRADEFIAGMERTLAPSRRHGYSHYHYLLAWKHLLAGEHQAAQSHADSAFGYAEETGFVFPVVLCRIETARILLETGRLREAREHAAAAHQQALDSNSLIFRYMSLLALAQIAFSNGSEKTGLRHLRDALELSRRHGYMSELWWHHPPSFSRLCAKALNVGIETEHVRSLIRKHKLAPEQPDAAAETWPWQYRISTMGTLRIVKDDKPLRLPAKTPKKPLELLKALIAFGGSDVSEERITDALWPDATGDAAHSAFTTTLQRLRKLLGDERVIIVQDGGVSLDRRYVWVDAWAFERMLESTESGVRNMEQADRVGVRNGNAVASVQNKSQIQQRLEKALKLYPGHFLAGDGDKPWAISMRERLRSKYLRAVAMLGRIHEEAGKHAKAAAVYQQGLDVDDLAEEFYQGLMTCYNNMERRSEAVRVYERCRKTLKAALKVEPGSTTEALFRNIVS